MVTMTSRTHHETVQLKLRVLLGNYCLKMLQESAALLEDSEVESYTADEEEASDSAADQWEQKKFVGLDHKLIEEHEQRVPCELVSSYEGARTLFLVGLEHLERVSSHYTLQDHASRHTETVQSISRLYQGLAEFEPERERKCKMHKRRVNMLSHLLDELNPQFYLQVCRQLRYELAETYSTMSTCKEPSSPSEDTTPQQWAKLNALRLSSIEHYKLFLSSFQTVASDNTNRYPEEAERAALVAYFHMGRLWNKMHCRSNSQAVVNIANAINCFKRVSDYVTAHTDCEEKIAEELVLCREMMQLLPVKLAQLQ